MNKSVREIVEALKPRIRYLNSEFSSGEVAVDQKDYNLLKEALLVLCDSIGCSDIHCKFRENKVGTNGRCRCYENIKQASTDAAKILEGK